jgi:hypothetical protein
VEKNFLKSPDTNICDLGRNRHPITGSIDDVGYRLNPPFMALPERQQRISERYKAVLFRARRSLVMRGAMFFDRTAGVA